jgi:hypothetical protein
MERCWVQRAFRRGAPHLWGWREIVRVGPFWLRLEPPAQSAEPGGALLQQLLDAQPTATPPPVAATRAMPTGMATASISTGRIGAVLEDKTLTLTPGQPAPLRLTLANLGTVVDHFSIEVEGAPAEWVRQPADALQLMPGVQMPVVLTVTAPRSPASRAGDYQVTLRVRSRENPSEVGVAHGQWTVLPFAAPVLSLAPKRATGRGQARFTTTLRNNGNAPIQCALRAEDDEHALRYRFEPPEVTLDPGADVDIPTIVSGRQRWFGREQTRSFTVGAVVAGGEGPPVATGQFVQMPIIPAWAVTLLLLLIPLCLGGVFFGNEMLIVRPAAATATAATAEAAGVIAAANTATADRRQYCGAGDNRSQRDGSACAATDDCRCADRNPDCVSVATKHADRPGAADPTGAAGNSSKRRNRRNRRSSSNSKRRNRRNRRSRRSSRRRNRRLLSRPQPQRRTAGDPGGAECPGDPTGD